MFTWSEIPKPSRFWSFVCLFGFCETVGFSAFHRMFSQVQCDSGGVRVKGVTTWQLTSPVSSSLGK